MSSALQSTYTVQPMSKSPSNPDPNDLLARLQALPPEERAALLAQLGLPAAAFAIGPNAQTGDNQFGDIAGRDVRKGVEGGVNLSDDARIDGVAVGVNLGTIIYGRTPEEDERRRLVWYLHALAGDLRRLPLRGLDPALAEGRGVDLARVYVMLATTSEHGFYGGLFEHLANWFENNDPSGMLKEECLPDHALPITAVINTSWWPADARMMPDTQWHTLYRSLLAVEAVTQQIHLVLLGDPGSGKSTFLRHLAWALARRGLDQAGPETQLFGWPDERRLLPVILPLRRLAGALAVTNGGAQTVYQALGTIVAGYGVKEPDDLLTDALVRGAAIVLLDGLDEVPVEATETSASRLVTLRAVGAFAERYGKTSLVLTCRSRAFTDELGSCLDWPVETLAPFTLGQVRHFVPAWYGELVAAGQLTEEQAGRLSDELIDTVVDNQRLRSMAETPLLLTLMALLLFRRGTLPRDRPRLYEEILELLLGQWDKVRDGQSLAEVIGRPDWTSERLRPLLDRLSYEAHRAGSSMDGRGRLERGRIRDALIDFFEAANVPEPWGAARRCLHYFEQRSGLLVPDGAESYVFAHLTLQEHCAGRHLLLSRDAVRQVLDLRDQDRWREPIFLGLGVVQATNPYLVEKVLRTLIDQSKDDVAKPVARWYRDLILAAELGNDRDWAYLREQEVDVKKLQADLRTGLVDLLADPNQPLPTAERVRAGFLLGDLGDPRFPVTVVEWQAELARAGEPDSYFCRVEPGEYIIGSSDDDPDADDTEKPQHRFTLTHPLLIARYPITNAQWQAWVAQGGQPSYSANDPDHNRPNQAIVGVNQLMSEAFCAWLTERLAGALPPGWVLRLPTEQEWEAAARGGDARRYPWGDDWRDDHAATEEDRETRGWRWNLPVGCYPAGAAPCGALDMAGNVWEWTTSVWQSYPGANKAFTDADWRVLRGGYYGSKRTNVRCGARGRLLPDVGNSLLYGNGFRIVVAPPLAH
jgi:formylglycine-generating enzyme required for sulfatase activity/energy-coupling factor transporter ATP-binding protein EcfA2